MVGKEERLPRRRLRALAGAGLAAVVAGTALPGAGAAPTFCGWQPGWGRAHQDLAREVVRRVNAHRAARGLRQLRITSTLSRSAVWKARHMLRYRYFDHDDPDPPVRRTFQRRLVDCAYRSGAGENIAYGQASPSAVMQAWLRSPGHRANIEDPSYRVIGVGAAGGSSSRRWVQDFGVRDDSGPNAPPTARADFRTVYRGRRSSLKVLGNDTDDTESWLHLISVRRPGKGTITIGPDGRALGYRPSARASGTDRFRYTVSDLRGLVDTAQVTVTIRRAGA